VVVEDSEVGIEEAAAAGMKAFQYVRKDATSSCRAGDEVSFDDMSQLPQLLAHFASNAQLKRYSIQNNYCTVLPSGLD
jgi:beta-phosphoglucomutase-like phosphatase (HAD superfamily)